MNNETESREPPLDIQTAYPEGQTFRALATLKFSDKDFLESPNNTVSGSFPLSQKLVPVQALYK